MATCCKCRDQIDYYWRDYYGTIPHDALCGGKNMDGSDIYIGQIYLQEASQTALTNGTIYQGEKEVAWAKTNIKILCTQHKHKFRWLPTTSKTLHVDTAAKHAVVGGYNNLAKGYTNIARMKYEGSTVVGAIATFHIGAAHSYYALRGGKRVGPITDYEVLIYETEEGAECCKESNMTCECE